MRNYNNLIRKERGNKNFQIFFNFNLREFNTTLTDEKLIAIPAYIGVNITPKIG